MKTTKPTPKKRTRPTAKSLAKPAARRSRPLHKRLLLHPFSVMILLCAGVIVLGSTFQGFAASYDVTASVPAEPPTGPAVITQPFDQQHVSTADITVSGTCPAGTYVKLYHSAIFSGVAQCSNQTFSIQTSLLPGPNQLTAKVYNVTNLEGPQSSPITVIYDETILPPPSPSPSVPTSVRVVNIEQSSFIEGAVRQTSPNPTIRGYAPPYAFVTVTFHSDPLTCITQADGQGWWSCTLRQSLPPGEHRVEITARLTSGAVLSLPAFRIRVTTTVATVLKPVDATPLRILSEYQFQTHYVGQPFTWNFGAQGGTPPYTLVIHWGDGSSSTFDSTDGATFTTTHAYPEVKTYAIFVNAKDATGRTALLQLNAVVKGQSDGIVAFTNSEPLVSVFSTIRRYLWIVWPLYLAVVLMAVSYWLGEQEVYARMRRHRFVRVGKGR